MRWINLLAITSLFAASQIFAAAPDFDADVKSTTSVIAKLWPVYDMQVTAGDLKVAIENLLAAFPADKRSAGQAYVLGNVLYVYDHKVSYELHQAAAKAEPQNHSAIWEWSLEQHRAGDFAGALASYQIYSKTRPEFSAAYALQADCLLHLGRLNEAIEAWRQSELAPDGSIETMESLVCAVHMDAAPHARRVELLAAVKQKHDVTAACDLIALDCDFPRDWWNGGPDTDYLANDLPAINAALKLPPEDVRGRAMSCAVECLQLPDKNAAAVNALFAKYKLLIDADQTLPAHGGLLTILLSAATQSKAIDAATLRKTLGTKLLDLARKGADPQLWSAAAFCAPVPTAEQLTFNREGWKATGDFRFAAGVLLLKARDGNLKGDDAELIAALKQFPQNGLVRRIAFEVAMKEKTITREMLAAAAMAEFTHFTSFVAPATVVDRPRAGYLRQYFAEMQRLPAATKPAATQP